MTTIWNATGVTPAATDRLPVDISGAGGPSRWTGQQVADINVHIGQTYNALGSIATGTNDIDLTLGAVVSATATGDFTFTFSNPAASGNGCRFLLLLTDGGAHTITWPGSVTWVGGTAPDLAASGTDKLYFDTVDGGTTWYGELAFDEATATPGSDTQVLFNDGGVDGADAGLTYNKTTDVLTAKTFQAQKVSNAPLLQTGTTSADASLIWATGNELQAARGDIGALIDFRANIVKASVSFDAGGYSMAVYNSGMAFGTTSFGAFANATCHSLYVCGALGGYDTALTREAAGHLIQRNSTTAQQFSLANTYTDASNYEIGGFKWNGNVLEIGAYAAGTGTQRAISMQGVTSFGALSIATNGVMTRGSNSLDINGSWSGSGNKTISSGSLVIQTGATGWTSILNESYVESATYGFRWRAYAGETELHVGGQVCQNDAAPSLMTIRGPAAKASATTNVTGGGLFIYGGAGASGSAGAANGGAVNLDGGQGYGTGEHGDVVVGATRGVLRLPTKTVATLPAATTAGRRCFVSDANATTFYSVVAGGGANFVPVFSDGTDWRIG